MMNSFHLIVSYVGIHAIYNNSDTYGDFQDKVMVEQLYSVELIIVC